MLLPSLWPSCVWKTWVSRLSSSLAFTVFLIPLLLSSLSPTRGFDEDIQFTTGCFKVSVHCPVAGVCVSSHLCRGNLLWWWLSETSTCRYSSHMAMFLYQSRSTQVVPRPMASLLKFLWDITAWAMPGMGPISGAGLKSAKRVLGCSHSSFASIAPVYRAGRSRWYIKVF